MILKNADPDTLGIFLQEQKWLLPKEKITRLSSPGSGNMNFVTRVHSSHRTFIVKQSRPYVEKYPSVPAPQERTAIEYDFYQFISSSAAIQQYMPKVIGYEPVHHILAIEDAGNIQEGSVLYQQNNLLQQQHIVWLTDYLCSLHSFSYSNNKNPERFANNNMRALNALHIFDFPFQEENGFNLDIVQPGLQSAATPYKTDTLLKEKLATLRSVYTSQGNYLLHGDFYPGSWLIDPATVKIIDPEFCFYGPVEFDLGVFMAHLKIMRCPDQLLQEIVNRYQLPVNILLLNAFTGTEILRRLIGLAQLPLTLTISEKEELMQEARNLVVQF
jgi:5-methylthioribose kinase